MVLVFEAFAGCLGPTAESVLVERLGDLPVPLPSAERGYDQLLTALGRWFATATARVTDDLKDLSAGEQITADLPDRAVTRYDEAHETFSGQIPEFAIGIPEPGSGARGLDRLESALRRATSGRDPSRHRAALARVYRAELAEPVLGGDVGDLVLPTLGDAYLDPFFRVKAADPAARPADEHWWDDDVRTDLAEFLAAYLTTTQATEAPLLLLGQPGAGKSSLTKILAARLPVADYLVARVALRDVPAEAEIQDQIEQALRAAIGETVSWADLTSAADGALPVILLDGFDELLQATGLHQSDYLQRVARFQQREAALGRPAAVMVTSRLAVADRAKLPMGGLAVRLEPFNEDQIAGWAEVWNESNAGRLPQPLALASLLRFRQLAEQPLLLLMLALYEAAGHALRDTRADFDDGRLYERLLSEFAEREVRRVHDTRPGAELPALVEAELQRLSVVAFAMFHRLRLWVTERELDDDLTGLGLAPSRSAPTEMFRTPLSAGQEMVGRFFFIQRSHAIRDDHVLQTYEFLHATFGEYLVARLVVQAVRDTERRESAGTMTLRVDANTGDDLLQTLLGYTPLSARLNVLSFIEVLMRQPDTGRLRAWLVRRASSALTRPQYTPRKYQPVDKRIDHWMATYSFNLVLLILKCGGELRASDLFTETDDPADWLQGAALQWRAAVPSRMWLETMAILSVGREWHGDRRDIVVSPLPAALGAMADPNWFNRRPPAGDHSAGGAYDSEFELVPALNSMRLSNDLADDALLHAVTPLLLGLAGSVSSFVVQEENRVESAGFSLTELWMASALDAPRDVKISAYRRAIRAALGNSQGMADSAALLMHSLYVDTTRLEPADVLRLINDMLVAKGLDFERAATLAVHCLLAPGMDSGPGWHSVLTDVLLYGIDVLEVPLLAAALHAVLDDSPEEANRFLIDQLSAVGDGDRIVALERFDPVLKVKLARYR